MTNFEKLLKKEMKDPEFRKEFMNAKIERLFLESLKEIRNKIEIDLPKNKILFFIDNLEKNIFKEV